MGKNRIKKNKDVKTEEDDLIPITDTPTSIKPSKSKKRNNKRKVTKSKLGLKDDDLSDNDHDEDKVEEDSSKDPNYEVSEAESEGKKRSGVRKEDIKIITKISPLFELTYKELKLKNMDHFKDRSREEMV
jgi:hypothetical protein